MTNIMNAAFANSAEVPAEYITAVVDVTAGNSLTVTAGLNLVSVTLRNRDATTATFQVGVSPALEFDVGESWSTGGVEENGGIMTSDIVVTAGDGIIRVTTVRRAP